MKENQKEQHKKVIKQQTLNDLAKLVKKKQLKTKIKQNHMNQKQSEKLIKY